MQPRAWPLARSSTWLPTPAHSHVVLTSAATARLAAAQKPSIPFVYTSLHCTSPRPYTASRRVHIGTITRSPRRSSHSPQEHRCVRASSSPSSSRHFGAPPDSTRSPCRVADVHGAEFSVVVHVPSSTASLRVSASR
jgi:hypothetical protein